MSVAENMRPKNDGGNERIAIGLVIVAALGILLYLSSSRQQALRYSPSGMDGLVRWLNAEKIEARAFTGGYYIDTETIGLNISPVYDTRPGVKRKRPETQEELLFQVDENDLTAGIPVQRARVVKTLVVLPKWRSGMRLTGIGHPALLIDPKTYEGVVKGLAEAGAISHIPRPFTRFDYRDAKGDLLKAELYVAQTFEGKGCEAIIGKPGQMILGACRLKGDNEQDRVFILSDPDLLNNHGLRLGDNARIARDFIARQADGKTVLVDYSLSNFMRSGFQRRVTRDREWSDLLRFFEYPFSMLWVGAALLMGLTFWRAGQRFGPLPASLEGPSASKQSAMAAQAKLLRLTDQDGALLREYVPARLATVANTLFGVGHLYTGGDEAIILRHLDRNKPALATSLRDVLEAIRALPDALSPREAIGFVDEFEHILEQITHDT